MGSDEIALEGTPVSTAGNSFDPRQAIEGLFGYVKDMAAGSMGRGFKPEPHADRVEAAVLAALEAGTKTAAQIVKSIHLAAGGTWAPTDGQVNQALAKLSEAELVSSKTKSDRKTYSLTKAGENALAEAKEQIAAGPSVSTTKRLANMDWLNCEPVFLKAASKLPPVMLDIAQTATREQQHKAAEILEKARHDLHKVLAEK